MNYYELDRLVNEFGMLCANASILLNNKHFEAARQYLMRASLVVNKIALLDRDSMNDIYLWASELRTFTESLDRDKETAYVKEQFEGLFLHNSSIARIERLQEKIEDKEKPKTILELLTNSIKAQNWLSNIYEVSKRSVGAISSKNFVGSYNSMSGTGFVISKNGLIITCRHVVIGQDGNQYDEIKIKFPELKCESQLLVIAHDVTTDVALCKVINADMPILSPVERVEDYVSLRNGAEVAVIGNTQGMMKLNPFAGHIVSTDEKGMLVHDAHSNPGDSGAPIFNVDNKCIGINRGERCIRSSDGDITQCKLYNSTPMASIEKLLTMWIKD